MNIKPFIKAIAALAVSGMMLNASATSVGFDSMEYDGSTGQITVTVNFDFTVEPMLGGGLDITYDSSALEFVSFERGELPMGAQAGGSPDGDLVSPGLWEGIGVGTFDIFNGITGAGSFATWTFNVLGVTNPDNTECGQTLCLSVTALNPFVTLAGVNVNDSVIDVGAASVNAAVVPVPAAVWLMLSGLGALLGFGRKSA